MANSAKNACADLTAGSAAVQLVGDAHGRFTNLGMELMRDARGALMNLSNTPFKTYDFDYTLDFNAPVPGYNVPVPPDLDITGLALRDPGFGLADAPRFVPGSLAIDAPQMTERAEPALAFGPRPDRPDVLEPVPPPPGSDIVIPDMPTYSLPAVPTFDQLRMPELLEVTLPEFNLTLPEFIEPPFNQTWDFHPEPYTSGLRDMLVEALTPIIQGQQALPPPIEAMIFEQMRSRIEKETQRGVEQAYVEYGSRGFDMPSGILSAMVGEVRQAGANQIAEASRDTAIEQHKQTLELFKFAITQGTALEGTLVQLHIEEQRFLLEASRLQMQTQELILKARIDVFNARMDGYRTEAGVFKDRLSSALAKLDVYRAKLEGERLRGELNQQKVALYNALIDGVKAKADFYRTRLEGVKVQADIERAEIDRYKTEVEASSERWRAYAQEWQGYQAGVEAESKRVDVYRALIESDSARISVWSKQADVKMEQERLRMGAFDAEMKAWGTGLERLRMHFDAESARINATAKANEARARVFEAEAQVASTQSAAEGRVFEAGMRREQAKVDLQLKQADMAIRQQEWLADNIKQIRQALAQTYSQLASSTLSAVSYGASVSDGYSHGRSCSTSFSYSGEIVDA